MGDEGINLEGMGACEVNSVWVWGPTFPTDGPWWVFFQRGRRGGHGMEWVPVEMRTIERAAA